MLVQEDQLKTAGLVYLDKRLNVIQTLLEEGNQITKDSREELNEEIGHLHDKVDKVQDTVTYIKKKITTFTPVKLAFVIILCLGLWIIFIYWFHIVKPH